MPKSNVTDSCVKRMLDARNAVKRIKNVRRSIIANILILGISLGISYLVMLLRTEGGAAGYLALSAEQRFPNELLCILVTLVCFFLYHGLLLILQFAASKRQDQARIDMQCQDDTADTTQELEQIIMRVHKRYWDLIFKFFQQDYKLDRTMILLSLAFLVIGITLSFLKLMTPAWLPILLVLFLDLAILTYRLHFSGSKKAVEKEKKYISAFMYTQQVMHLAENLPDGPMRNNLYKSAAETMLDRCVPDKNAQAEKNVDGEKEDLPGLRLIFRKKTE